MAKLRSLMAICLALVLVFSPVSMAWAEGPGDNSVNTDTSDGADGHPWDDGTTEQETQPDDDDEVIETDQLYGTLLPVSTVKNGFGGWIEWTLTQLYHKVTGSTRIIQKKGTTKTSPRERGTRRVIR